MTRARSSVVVVDYGMGNLGSVCNALRFLGYAPEVTSDDKRIAAAQAIVLPGVGAFAQAMDNLRSRGLVEVLGEEVRGKGKPFLGICLGMQLLAASSTEMGLHEGLGWIAGRVLELRPAGALSVPHVGWNNVQPGSATSLFTNLGSNPENPLEKQVGTHPGREANFYFDHSFHLVCDDPADVAAVCEYGGPVVAAVQRGSLFATQFHPEKSQTSGLKLLRNFLNYVEAAC